MPRCQILFCALVPRRLSPGPGNNQTPGQRAWFAKCIGDMRSRPNGSLGVFKTRSALFPPAGCMHQGSNKAQLFIWDYI